HFSNLRFNPLSAQELGEQTDSSLGARRPSNFTNYCDNALNELITKCYHTLDANASIILLSESSSLKFESLDYHLVIKILSRDTLRLNSESEVFNCLDRWAEKQCLQQQKELTS